MDGYGWHVTWMIRNPSDSVLHVIHCGCKSACETGRCSAWMTKHHLQLSLAKTELLIIPAKPSISHDLSITLGSESPNPWDPSPNTSSSPVWPPNGGINSPPPSETLTFSPPSRIGSRRTCYGSTRALRNDWLDLMFQDHNDSYWVCHVIDVGILCNLTYILLLLLL